jgi:hypothetical protein
LPDVDYDLKAANLVLNSKGKLTFVNSGDKIAAVTKAAFIVDRDDDREGICINGYPRDGI